MSTRVAIYLRDGLCCVYCLQDFSVAGLTIDHIVSRAHGGSNAPTNIVSACMHCNGLKRVVGLERLAQLRGMTLRCLRRRLLRQAQPLSPFLRSRALSAIRNPPGWLIELRRLNGQWEAVQPSLFAEGPAEDEPAEPPDYEDDEIPF